MSQNRDHERSPFEKLKHHYEETDLECHECGYDDTEGEWQTQTTGDTVEYRHVCPSCGAIQRRTLSVGEE
ncbi:hypothetical protein SAMN04487950_3928 [Halogranum rubrum]|uniref:Small CPxCG-related zinc finger protein n=2 Tax=Halogranum rubrum TaxID=553466 RepID=A0A1I4I408_9EURY|nr:MULTISPECIES: HVO_0649 family zinc finger protein [Halogranum]EJN61134.1 hypothetical protein HSB1_01750 [Halogranum salarium B-1]SFL48703.1 hypothetical protein SAMN04487950_3928 [Halogranum rubrum]